VYASGNTFASLDSLEVIGDPEILNTGTHDEAGSAFSYEGAWQTMNTSGPYQDTLHYTYEVGAYTQVAFHGTQIQLSYLATSSSESVDVYIDGLKVATIDQHSTGWDWQVSWTSGQFADGDHILKLVYTGGGAWTFGSIDSVTVNP
jgi:hypothetical protein